MTPSIMPSHFSIARFVLPTIVVVGAAAGAFPSGAAAQQTVSPLVACTGTYRVSVQGGTATWSENTTGNTSTFTVTNNSDPGCRATFFLSYTATDPISGVSLSKSSVNLQPGKSASVTATYNVGAEGSGTLTLHASGPGTSADGSYIITVVAPPANTTYTLSYVGDSVLDKMTDPAGRVLDATVSGGLLLKLKDPSGDSVLYTYDAQRRDTIWTDRRGHQTHYQYAHGLRVTSFEIPLSSQSDLHGDSIINWDEAGLVIGQPGGTHTAADPTTVYTRVNGPRLDVTDTTTFWVDRWGAPDTIDDALGHRTVITRGDVNVPALVTQVQDPTGFTKQATYDARGNILTSTEVSPYGAGDATTSYAWDPTWDFVTEIKRPEGDSLVLAYDASNGNRLWQQDGRGSSSRVTFNYANTYHLLSSVVYPGGARDSLTYGGALGNPLEMRSPLGFVTTHRQDQMGRDTLVLTPMDAGQQFHQQRRFAYDAMNRDTLGETIGPAMNGAPADTLVAKKTYDPEGNLVQVSNSSHPDPAGIGQDTTEWAYDFAGRRIKETAPDGHSDSTVYDPAGNPDTVYTRRTDPTTGVRVVITTTYDVLNHLISRHLPSVAYPSRREGIPAWRDSIIAPGNDPSYPYYSNDANGGYTIPADVASFTYDELGHIRAAVNGDAVVRRGYYPNGRVEGDTLKIRTVYGQDTTTHVYALNYFYDLDGRRVGLKHPDNIAPRLTGILGAKDSTGYAYDPATGLLSTVTDPLGYQIRYFYNLRGEVDSLALPGGITQRLEYDLDGRIAADSVRNGSGSLYKYGQPYLLKSVLGLDAQGRVLSSRDASGTLDTLTSLYSGLGQVVDGHVLSHAWTANSDTAWSETAESQQYDAFGDLTSVQDTGSWWISGSEFLHIQLPQTYYYEGGTGRLREVVDANQTDASLYDGAGDIEYSYQPYWIHNYSNEPYPQLRDRANYYAADGLLRASDHRVLEDPVHATNYRATFEEYRYDALGRRILVRARRYCEFTGTNTPECRLSKVRRVIWDGNQELYEIQMPGDSSSPYLESDTAHVQLSVGYCFGCGDSYVEDLNPFFGRVAYTTGVALDQPVSIVRMGYGDKISATGDTTVAYRALDPFSIFPVWLPERGQPHIGVFDDGGTQRCENISGWLRCVIIGWPSQWFAYKRPSLEQALFWHGSLLADKRDDAGTYYRRNRYYDPQTGRFTQEDPIGLAGGLNLYGFANGDPVNFFDPFGLCSIADWSDCRMFSLTVGVGVGAKTHFQVGPVEVTGTAGKVGLEKTWTLDVSGNVASESGGTATAIEGKVRLASHELDVAALNCTTGDGCHLFSVGRGPVTAASNGDVSFKGQVGVEIGVTFHAAEAATAVAGAARWLYDEATDWLKRHTTMAITPEK